MRIIACGNRERNDDGVGVEVAQRLRALGVPAEIQTGETTALMEAWSAEDDVIVVDAVMTGAPVGTLHRWDNRQTVPLPPMPVSSHGSGVAEAVELARALGRLPRHLRVHGIEGKDFRVGSHISEELMPVVEELVQTLQKIYKT